MRDRSVGEARPGTATAIGRRAGPSRQLLETSKANQGRLHLHILQGQIVVGKVERFTYDYATLLSGLRWDQSLIFNLLCSMLVFKLILQVVIAFSRLVALLGEIILILINFRL
mgnify:CR=1 FL=1